MGSTSPYGVSCEFGEAFANPGVGSLCNGQSANCGCRDERLTETKKPLSGSEQREKKKKKKGTRSIVRGEKEKGREREKLYTLFGDYGIYQDDRDRDV